MPSSLRARSSAAASPDLRSSTSAASASLRCLRPALSRACCCTCACSAATCRSPPSPNQRRYCSHASSASLRTIRIARLRNGVESSALERDEGVAPGIAGIAAQLLFDAQQLVVLRDTIAAAQRARLDLRRRGGDRDVGDGGVFGLA